MECTNSRNESCCINASILAVVLKHKKRKVPQQDQNPTSTPVPGGATQTRAGPSESKDSEFLGRQTFARGMWKVSSTDYPAKIKDALSKRGFVVYL